MRKSCGRPTAAAPVRLDGFYFPRSVAKADLIVSLPKMKTHHWVGMTAAMKNLYGTIPGVVYGWPKNVLHHAGIPQTVYDINASLPKTIAIVDGILCMEGDGPIMGSPKSMGLILIGPNAAAVDATAARIMNLRPENISYLVVGGEPIGTDRRRTHRAMRRVLARPGEAVFHHRHAKLAHPAGRSERTDFEDLSRRRGHGVRMTIARKGVRNLFCDHAEPIKKGS